MSTHRLAALLAAGLLLSGCDTQAANQLDPYKREGMWRPEGVNAANIAAQLAEPRDLVRGRGDSGPQIKQAATAVTRVWGGAAAPGGGAAAAGAGGNAAAAGGAAALLRGLGSGGEAGR
jgi:hypothetical protein